MKRILILGATSFVANGFKELALKNGYEVDSFGRKNGSYFTIDRNPSLAYEYDVVINFAILKDHSADDNVKYLKSLVKMCKEHNVKKLLHFSSIMVYSRKNSVVNEHTPIDSSKTSKLGGYGRIKIVTDEYLDSIKNSLDFELILVRPGYVIAPGTSCPFIKHLVGPIHVVLGDKNSTMPLVRREDIHTALMQIIQIEKNLPVYLFCPNEKMTKYMYAKSTVGWGAFFLPKWLFERGPYLMARLGIIPWTLYSRFEGMFTSIIYSSELTEKTLHMNFKW